jgi:hypothetical protein
VNPYVKGGKYPDRLSDSQFLEYLAALIWLFLEQEAPESRQMTMSCSLNQDS